MKRFAVLVAALVIAITLANSAYASGKGGHSQAGHGNAHAKTNAANTAKGANTTKGANAAKGGDTKTNGANTAKENNGAKGTAKAGKGHGTPPSHWRGHYHAGYGAWVYTDPDSGYMYIWDADLQLFVLIRD